MAGLASDALTVCAEAALKFSSRYMCGDTSSRDGWRGGPWDVAGAGAPPFCSLGRVGMQVECSTKYEQHGGWKPYSNMTFSYFGDFLHSHLSVICAMSSAFEREADSLPWVMGP